MNVPPIARLTDQLDALSIQTSDNMEIDPVATVAQGVLAKSPSVIVNVLSPNPTLKFLVPLEGLTKISTVYRRAFANTWKETQAHEIDWREYSEQAVTYAVQYINQAAKVPMPKRQQLREMSVDESLALLPDLYALADKYDIAGIIEECAFKWQALLPLLDEGSLVQLADLCLKSDQISLAQAWVNAFKVYCQTPLSNWQRVQFILAIHPATLAKADPHDEIVRAISNQMIPLLMQMRKSSPQELSQALQDLRRWDITHMDPEHQEALSRILNAFSHAEDPLNFFLTAFRKPSSERIPLLEQAVQIDPNFVLAHSILGSEYFRKGDLDAALLACNRALELDPSHIRTLSWRIELHATRKNISLLEEDCDRILMLAPHKIVKLARHGATKIFFIQRAEILWKDKSRQKVAVEYLNCVLKENFLGNSLTELYVTEGWEQKARMLRGSYLYQLGQFNQALGDFTVILNSDRSHAGACFKIGQCTLALEDYPNALHYLQQVVHQYPGPAWYGIGDTYHKMGQIKEAIAAWDKVPEGDPLHSKARTAIQKLI